jgi:hypothetical protein
MAASSTVLDCMRVLPLMAMGPDGEVQLVDAWIFKDAAGSLGGAGEHVIGIAVEKPGRRVGKLGGAFGGSDDPRRLAAFGGADEEVAVFKAELFKLPCAILGMILEGLDGLDEREIAAGHEGADAVLTRPGEHALPAEDFETEREPAGGSAAAEIDTFFLSQRFHRWRWRGR